MKVRMKLMSAAVALALTSNWALAEDGEEGQEVELDVTISVMPEGADLPGVVTGDIMLPTDEEGVVIAAEAAMEHSATGLETANSARTDGRAFGEAAAEAAQANREDIGRGSPPALEGLLPTDLPVDLSGVPGSAPDAPELPDVPSPELPDVPAPGNQ